MRVCFDGLCFARRAAAVDEETQTVSEFHDTGGGGGHTNHVYISDTLSNNQNINNSNERNQCDSSKDSTDSSHKNHKNHHCSTTSTARSKLLSLLSLNNLDRKIFFVSSKMDTNDTPRVHNVNSNTYDIDLVNRNHSNNVSC